MTRLKTSIFLLTLTLTLLLPGFLFAKTCNTSIMEIYKKVAPAIVSITATSIDPYSANERIRSSLGSGFIVDRSGIVLTNAHVVFGQQVIVVHLNHDEKVVAELVGLDPQLDLAVLKIAPSSGSLQALPLAETEAIQVGVDVLAIGNPFGLGQTVTRGIVSGLNRVLPTSPMSMTVPMIQTDASINPGNSGGPLINYCGEVLGINTSGFVDAENVGFALPASIIRLAYPAIVKNGRIIRPWIGVNGKLIRKVETHSLFNLDVVDGFLIEAVDPGSPAEKAGIKGGILPIRVANDDFLFGDDIITAINGKSFANAKNYAELVGSLKVGDKLKIDLYRSGRRQSVSVHVVERPLLPWDIPFDDKTRRY